MTTPENNAGDVTQQTETTILGEGDNSQSTEDNTMLGDAKAGDETSSQEPDGNGEDVAAEEGAAKEGETNSKDDGEDKDAKDADKDEGAPEAYEAFKLPEGVELDEAMLEKATPIFKEMGLSQEKAQQFIDLYTDVRMAEATKEAEAFAEVHKNWVQTVKKQFGDGDTLKANMTFAGKAIDKFGGPKLREMFNETGIGNNPVMVEFMVNLGKMIGEDGVTPNGDAGGGDKDRAEIMYPSAKTK